MSNSSSTPRDPEQGQLRRSGELHHQHRANHKGSSTLEHKAFRASDGEKMNLTKSDWYIIQFFLLAFVMVGLSELGYGIFALFLLFPAYMLLVRAFEKDKPSD